MLGVSIRLLLQLGPHLDLSGTQRGAFAEAEGRHRAFLCGRDSPAFGDDPQQLRVGNDGEEERVVERRRRAELAVGPVAAGAVRTVESVEILDFVGRHRSIGLAGLAGKVAARGQKEDKETRRQGEGETGRKGGRETGRRRGGDIGPRPSEFHSVATTSHGSLSLSPLLLVSPCLYGPATKSATRSGPRPAGGMWTISERCTTTAATTPNTNWETMNQAQSTRSCSTGLTTPMSA